MAETVDVGKLKFTGIFYLVSKKDGEDNTWEIKHQSPTTSSIEIESSAVDDYFPKPSSNLAIADKSYWGFFTNKNDDLKKICSSTACTTNSGNPSIDYKEFS